MDNLLSLKIDYAFNRLFSQKINKNILKDFISSILDINIEKIEIIPETITVAKKHKDYEMVQSIRYHFIELPKFRRQHPDLNDKLEQWFVFIDGKNNELVQMVIKKNKEIKKASEELEYLSVDEELKRLEFLKFKATCDEASRIGYLVEKSLKEGIEQGEKNKSIEIAKNMLQKNIDIETIIEITGLTKENIEKIILKNVS